MAKKMSQKEIKSLIKIISNAEIKLWKEVQKKDNFGNVCSCDVCMSYDFSSQLNYDCDCEVGKYCTVCGGYVEPNY
jgi:hypothetical protein